MIQREWISATQRVPSFSGVRLFSNLVTSEKTRCSLRDTSFAITEQKIWIIDSGLGFRGMKGNRLLVALSPRFARSNHNPIKPVVFPCVDGY